MKRILFSRTSKTPVSSLCEYTFNIKMGRKINKINIGRKQSSSQWLIPFRKMRPCKLSLRRGYFINNLRPVMTLWKGVYHQENQKIHQEFQHRFKGNHFWPWKVPPRVSPCVPVAFWVGQLVLHWGHTLTIICD